MVVLAPRVKGATNFWYTLAYIAVKILSACLHSKHWTIAALADLAFNPLTFDPLRHRHAFVEASQYEASELALDQPTSARFYMRQFVFESWQELLQALKEVDEKKPCWQYITARIRSYVMLLPEDACQGGRLRLPYGGFTIANTVTGRTEDDHANLLQESFIIAFCQHFSRQPVVHVWKALTFGVNSVIAARADSRTGLYEGLIIDACGRLSGANTR